MFLTMGIREDFAEIKDLIPAIETDVNSFCNKNTKAAAVRARGALQKIRKMALELRKDLNEAKKKVPKKK